MFFVILWWLIFLMTLMLMQTSKISFELFSLLINSYLFEHVAELLDTQILYSWKFSPGENFCQFCHLLSLVKFYLQIFYPVLMIT